MNTAGAPTECVKIGDEYHLSVFIEERSGEYRSGFVLVCSKEHSVKVSLPDSCQTLREASASALGAAHVHLSRLASAHSGLEEKSIETAQNLASRIEDRLREIRERQMQLFEVSPDAP